MWFVWRKALPHKEICKETFECQTYKFMFRLWCWINMAINFQILVHQLWERSVQHLYPVIFVHALYLLCISLQSFHYWSHKSFLFVLVPVNAIWPVSCFSLVKVSELFHVPGQGVWPVSCFRSGYLASRMFQVKLFQVKVSDLSHVRGHGIWPVECSRSRNLTCVLFRVKVSDLCHVSVRSR